MHPRGHRRIGRMMTKVGKRQPVVLVVNSHCAMAFVSKRAIGSERVTLLAKLLSEPRADPRITKAGATMAAIERRPRGGAPCLGAERLLP